jgi:hypothetical protein
MQDGFIIKWASITTFRNMNEINGLSPLQYAQQHCCKGDLDCSWYHGNWHLLKALGVVSTSAVHSESIGRLLKLAVAGTVEPKILLSGSTDETLIRLVHDTCSALGIREKLYAVDICATPLAFMQAYAEQNGIELVTVHTDILEFETGEKFDVILTHAFMGYFDVTQRPLLTRQWRQLLSDEGRIVTIQRVRPVSSLLPVTFTAEQSSRFVAAAVEAVNAMDAGDMPDVATVREAATDFANNFSIHPITSRSALESLFTEAGLTFQTLEYHSLGKIGELSGPSVPSDAEFAHIIAGKSQD